MRRISRRLARSGALDVVATAVPGMKDILVLGKVKQLETAERRRPDHHRRARGRPRDHLPAVGPGAARRGAVGPIRKQAADVVELLTDPARCQVMLVTLPEETPVNELVDTAFAVEDRAGVALGPIVVNGCSDAVADRRRARRARRDRRRCRRRSTGSSRDREANDLAHAAAFRAERARDPARADRTGSSERLPLPQIRLPFLFTADIGPAEIELRSPTRSTAGSTAL